MNGKNPSCSHTREQASWAERACRGENGAGCASGSRGAERACGDDCGAEGYSVFSALKGSILVGALSEKSKWNRGKPPLNPNREEKVFFYALPRENI